MNIELHLNLDKPTVSELGKYATGYGYCINRMTEVLIMCFIQNQSRMQADLDKISEKAFYAQQRNRK